MALPTMALLRLMMIFKSARAALSTPPHPPIPPQPQHRPATLTSTPPLRLVSTCEHLPTPVLEFLVESGFSALRAWRTHRGISTLSVHERTHINYPTLLALDRGDVELCEWTVEKIAKALRIEPSLLLMAQSFVTIERASHR